MKLVATVLAYNCEPFVTEMLDSIKAHVDEIYVGLDEKTTDKTRDVIVKWASKKKSPPVWIIDNGDNSAHFGDARNRLQQKLPADVDWFFWIDTDDVLGADISLKDIIRDQGQQHGVIWFPYHYHRNEYGDVDTMFQRERLVRMDVAPIWENNVHELVRPRKPTTPFFEGGIQVKTIGQARLWVEHKNADRKAPGTGERNFKLLREALAKNPDDTRTRLYLAHQLFGSHQWYEAAQHYDTYVNARTYGDVQEEKYQAMIWAARAHRNAGNLAKSLEMATRAQLTLPKYRDAYIELAHTLAMQRQWSRAIEFHEDGIQKDQLNTILVANPLDYDLNPNLVMHIPYYQTKQYARALECITKALEFRPGDQYLKQQGAYYHAAWAREKNTLALLGAARHLLNTNEPLKAKKLLEAMPAGSTDDNDELAAQVRGAFVEVEERLAHLKSDAEYENFYMAEQPEQIKPTPELIDSVPQSLPRMHWVAEQILRRGGKRVLEIGVGNAVASLYYAKRGLQVVGVDIDPRRVKEANFASARFGHTGFRYYPEHKKRLPVIYRRGQPIRELGFQAHHMQPGVIPEPVKQLAPFDAVVAAEVVEHVPDIEEVLGWAEKVNGDLDPPAVYITTPDGGWRGQQAVNPSHVQAWSMKELQKVLSERGWVEQANRIQHPLPGEQPQIAFVYRPGDFKRANRPPVVIYCGPGLEPWDPDQLNREGLGGSETAVIEVARYIAANGYRVFVYGPSEGIWDNVVYRHWRSWRPDQTCWWFINWRHPELFDRQIAANVTTLWMHDVDAGPNITPERMKQVDFIYCLSKWHRDHLLEEYPFLKDTKCGLEHEHADYCKTQLVIVGNGIDPKRFEPPSLVGFKREPHRIIYTSSPDRGLEELLEMWPTIRTRWPDATLDIFYGWENYDRLGGDGAYKARIMGKIEELEGVTWRGRAGQADLAREMMKSDVLLYPGMHPFEETYCISVLEAQAAGCVPVTRDNGALPETNTHGIVVENDAPEAAWIRALAEAFSYKPKKRFQMSEGALKQTWGDVTLRMAKPAHERTKILAAEEEAAAAD